MYRYFQFFVAILLILALSACANSNYIKKAPKSYPHEQPTEKKSDGSYIGDETTTAPTQTTDSAVASPQDPLQQGNIKHDWTIADNGKEYKIGTPYKIGGRWYRPREHSVFSQNGVASWYGPNFHLKKTANGGIFDKNIASAAHKTLPLPSVVQVTNKDNGRSIIVKINDRGPYSKDRVIDLSQKAAQILDFEKNGTANVQIVYLPEESRQLKAFMQAKKTTPGLTKPTPTYNPAAPEPLAPQPALLQPTSPSPSEGIAKTPAKPVVGSRSSLTNEMPYKLQVGAFASENNAEKLKINLSEKYSHVSIVSGSQLHKVQIGFASRIEAENELPIIRYNLGFDSAFIIAPR